MSSPPACPPESCARHPLPCTARALTPSRVPPRAAQDHDLDTKLRKAREFLLKGHRVQITMMRPKRHMLDRGDDLLGDIVAELSDCGEVRLQRKSAQGGYEAHFDPLSPEARELLAKREASDDGEYS